MRDRLSQTFSALADPTRRAILVRLSHGDAIVSVLAEPFLEDMSRPAITKHLKVLEEAGLISKSRDGVLRPCRLNADGIKPAADWMEQCRALWEESFDRLDELLKTMASEEKNKGAKQHKGKAREHLKKTK